MKLLHFIFIFYCFYYPVFAQHYFIEIPCATEQETLIVKRILLQQEWLKPYSITTKDLSVYINSFDFNTGQKIKEKIGSELNLYVLVKPTNENLSVQENINGIFLCNGDSEDEIVFSSYTKIVNEKLLDEYIEPKIKQIISYAIELYTTPYKYGGNDIANGIDCSFFVKYIYSRLGINLPRTSAEQIKTGIEIDKNDLQFGDLVFFKKTYYRKVKNKYVKYERINHVGIYLRDNEFIHATRKSKKVTISSLNEPYYAKRFAGARRILKQ